MPADTESQHSSRSDEQSDSRTEHSDEDAAEKAPKRTASVRAAKKPAAAKTEVCALPPSFFLVSFTHRQGLFASPANGG